MDGAGVKGFGGRGGGGASAPGHSLDLFLLIPHSTRILAYPSVYLQLPATGQYRLLLKLPGDIRRVEEDGMQAWQWVVLHSLRLGTNILFNSFKRGGGAATCSFSLNETGLKLQQM